MRECPFSGMGFCSGWATSSLEGIWVTMLQYTRTLLPDGRSLHMSEELLRGAIDIHVHAGPHIFSSPRRVDPIQAAVQARDADMRAIVFMDVFEMSNGTSWLVNRVVEDFQTFGGLILNTVYSGLN